MKGVHNNTERGVEGFRVAKRLVQWVQSDIDMDKRGMERGMKEFKDECRSHRWCRVAQRATQKNARKNR